MRRILFPCKKLSAPFDLQEQESLRHAYFLQLVNKPGQAEDDGDDGIKYQISDNNSDEVSIVIATARL